MMAQKSAAFMLPGGYANAPSAVMDWQNGHGNVQLVATRAFVFVSRTKYQTHCKDIRTSLSQEKTYRLQNFCAAV